MHVGRRKRRLNRNARSTARWTSSTARASVETGTRRGSSTRSSRRSPTRARAGTDTATMVARTTSIASFDRDDELFARELMQQLLHVGADHILGGIELRLDRGDQRVDLAAVAERPDARADL